MQPTILAAPSHGRPLRSASDVEITREILRRLFAGVRAPVAIALEDGTMLYEADGQAQGTIVLRHPGVLRQLLTRTSDLAAGQAVVRGDIGVTGDIEQALISMDAVATTRTAQEWVEILSRATKLPRVTPETSSPGRAPAKLRGRPHSIERDRAAIAYHYDVSNDFYRLWLDENMIYSCAYFRRDSDSLDDAQEQKCDLICRKLRLEEGDRLLDIGCGWGGLIRFAVRSYGVRAVGVTLSRKQADYAREHIKSEGLQEHCSVELLDYRELGGLGQFDKIASIGMVEHVGDSMMVRYFESAHQALAPGGLFLNHGIISTRSNPKGVRALAAHFFPSRSRFTELYVFPDGEMPRLAHMCEAAENSGFEIRDVENLREHYTLTLRRWRQGLEANEDRARFLVGDATFNVWRFWLAGSAHHFATGRLGVVQMLLARPTARQSAGIPLLREDIYR